MTVRPAKKIFIDGDEADRPADLIQSLSHEVGHALYAYAPDTSSKAAYVRSHLGDEGMATISNIAIEREILAAGGPDIGIATGDPKNAAYNAIYDQYLRDGNLAKARDAIGGIYGDHEHTSNTGQTYREYYGSAYDRAQRGH